LAFWDRFLTKAEQELSTTVPLNPDIGTATYPDSNFENFAKQGYNKNEIVHACIRELAVSAATPRYFVAAPSTDGGTVEVDSGLLYDLTSNPNPYNDWYSFIERLVTFLMVAGNAYVLKERAKSGQVSGMYLLRPDRVVIVPGDYGAASFIYDVGGRKYTIDPKDMCHLALPNPAGDIYGLSPLEVLARNVNLDLNMTDFAKVYFQNAGVPSGLLKIKKRLSSQDEATTIRARWRSQFGGVNNFHRIAILDDDAEYQPMANTPKDMALNDLHNLTESRICAVLGVPPILVGANVGLQRSTFSNYREARLAFHSETLEPLVTRILRYFNRNLFDEYTGNESLSVDWTAMRSVLDDQAANTTRINTLFAGGVITLNEARTSLGFDALDEGAMRRIPSSVFEVAEGAAAPVAVGAAPVEQSLPALAEIKAPRVAPRARVMRRRIIEEREELTDEITGKVLTHFRGIRNRADGILGRLMERDLEETKAYPFEVVDMLPPIETGSMSKILEAAYRKISKKTFKTINDVGVAGNLRWSDKLPTIQNVLSAAPSRASMIHSTTSKAIQRAVGIGLERGYSIEQLARGVPDDRFPGIRAVLGETENRARLIARTEVMRTQNQTTAGFYKEQGFLYVQADDVDGGPDDNYVDPGDPYGRTCAERHGQIYTIEDAQNIDDHPNGTLNWMPMPRGYKPEETI
jgi:HK97 family phage portal protein